MDKILENTRKHKPLVHCISNYVTSNDMANMILATGGSPIMADEEDEVREIVDLAQALLLNIGTINKTKLRSMILAGQEAKESYTPIVFDPVGIGASSFRRKAGRAIISRTSPDIIKGNISEIKYLYNEGNRQLGVDSEDYSREKLDSYIEICKELSIRYGATIVMTGKVDIITNYKRLALIKNGNDQMERVTGTGCILGGIIAALMGESRQAFEAASLGCIIMGLAGDRALDYVRENDLGLGSFRNALIDQVSRLDYEDIKGEMEVEFY